MLYGCETWRLIERSKRTLETMEMDAIRQSMRISQRKKNQKRRSQTTNRKFGSR